MHATNTYTVIFIDAPISDHVSPQGTIYSDDSDRDVSSESLAEHNEHNTSQSPMLTDDNLSPTPAHPLANPEIKSILSLSTTFHDDFKILPASQPDALSIPPSPPLDCTPTLDNIIGLYIPICHKRFTVTHPSACPMI